MKSKADNIESSAQLARSYRYKTSYIIQLCKQKQQLNNAFNN